MSGFLMTQIQLRLLGSRVPILTVPTVPSNRAHERLKKDKLVLDSAKESHVALLEKFCLWLTPMK